MRFVMKIRHDNDLNDHISVVYVENYTELLGLIKPNTVYMKTRQNNDVTDLISKVYLKKEFEPSWSIKPGMVYDEN